MRTVKAKFQTSDDAQNDAHNVKTDPNVTSDYEKLVLKLTQLFPELSSGNFTIHCTGADGDTIVAANEEEVFIALSSLPPGGTLKISIEEKEHSSRVSSLPVCNCCGGAICGHQYKCTVCRDFNLCTTCEQRQRHSHHPVVRVTTDKPTGMRSNKTRLWDMGCHRYSPLFDHSRNNPTSSTRPFGSGFFHCLNPSAFEEFHQMATNLTKTWCGSMPPPEKETYNKPSSSGPQRTSSEESKHSNNASQNPFSGYHGYSKSKEFDHNLFTQMVDEMTQHVNATMDSLGEKQQEDFQKRQKGEDVVDGDDTSSHPSRQEHSDYEKMSDMFVPMMKDLIGAVGGSCKDEDETTKCSKEDANEQNDSITKSTSFTNIDGKSTSANHVSQNDTSSRSAATTSKQTPPCYLQANTSSLCKESTKSQSTPDITILDTTKEEKSILSQSSSTKSSSNIPQNRFSVPCLRNKERPSLSPVNKRRSSPCVLIDGHIYSNPSENEQSTLYTNKIEIPTLQVTKEKPPNSNAANKSTLNTTKIEAEIANSSNTNLETSCICDNRIGKVCICEREKKHSHKDNKNDKIDSNLSNSLIPDNRPLRICKLDSTTTGKFTGEATIKTFSDPSTLVFTNSKKPSLNPTKDGNLVNNEKSANNDHSHQNGKSLQNGRFTNFGYNTEHSSSSGHIPNIGPSSKTGHSPNNGRTPNYGPSGNKGHSQNNGYIPRGGHSPSNGHASKQNLELDIQFKNPRTSSPNCKLSGIPQSTNDKNQSRIPRVSSDSALPRYSSKGKSPGIGFKSTSLPGPDSSKDESNQGFSSPRHPQKKDRSCHCGNPSDVKSIHRSSSPCYEPTPGTSRDIGTPPGEKNEEESEDLKNALDQLETMGFMDFQGSLTQLLKEEKCDVWKVLERILSDTS